MARLWKIKINIGQDSRCCNQDFNQAPFKYKCKALPLYQDVKPDNSSNTSTWLSSSLINILLLTISSPPPQHTLHLLQVLGWASVWSLFLVSQPCNVVETTCKIRDMWVETQHTIIIFHNFVYSKMLCSWLYILHTYYTTMAKLKQLEKWWKQKRSLCNTQTPKIQSKHGHTEWMKKWIIK